MPIPVRYPLVELLTAAVFASVGLRFGTDWALPAFLFFAALLLAIGFIDVEHFIVPNRLVLVGLAAGIPLLAVAAVAENAWRDLGIGLFGAVAASGALLLLNLVYPRGMGMGDVKLALVLGLFLGFLDLGHIALGLFLGFFLGAIGGVLLIATGVRSRRDHVPFAPFLVAGALIAVLAGRQILDWYAV